MSKRTGNLGPILLVLAAPLCVALSYFPVSRTIQVLLWSLAGGLFMVGLVMVYLNQRDNA
ncbi:hypothetical protein [Nesterenkonia alba]|uniref:hypothetical protein n=1 Tax=Nesterenkonia alba TaxID=515814 RepID=UPI0003B4E344|nr:hypothetical protein [Nesterenkonia alba]